MVISKSPQVSSDIVEEPLNEAMNLLRLEFSPGSCFCCFLEIGHSFHLEELVSRIIASSGKGSWTVVLICPRSCCCKLNELLRSGACPPQFLSISAVFVQAVGAALFLGHFLLHLGQILRHPDQESVFLTSVVFLEDWTIVCGVLGEMYLRIPKTTKARRALTVTLSDSNLEERQ